jgi:hypothetical protein
MTGSGTHNLNLKLVRIDFCISVLYTCNLKRTRLDVCFSASLGLDNTISAVTKGTRRASKAAEYGAPPCFFLSFSSRCALIPQTQYPFCPQPTLLKADRPLRSAPSEAPTSIKRSYNLWCRPWIR